MFYQNVYFCSFFWTEIRLLRSEVWKFWWSTINTNTKKTSRRVKFANFVSVNIYVKYPQIFHQNFLKFFHVIFWNFRLWQHLPIVQYKCDKICKFSNKLFETIYAKFTKPLNVKKSCNFFMGPAVLSMHVVRYPKCAL